MKYTFKTDIDAREFDAFVESFPSTSFMQLSCWAKVKSTWDHVLAGMVDENDQLVCSAMILKRKLFLNWKLYYIPRGFVIDYSNEELLHAFVTELRRAAKKDGAIDIKVDPFTCFSEESTQKVLDGKDVDTIRLFTQDTERITSALIKEGFTHGGYKKEIGAYIQPRFTMAIPLVDREMKPLDKEVLRRSFPKNTRNYIGEYQRKRGVEFYYSQNSDDVKDLVKVLSCTEERQNIVLRNEAYFKGIMEAYPQHARLYFAKINISRYLDFLEEDAQKDAKRREISEKRKQEALEVREKYGEEPLVGATIVLLPTATSGIRVASFLYAGTNTDILPSLKITNGLMYYRLCTCMDYGATVCDLGGVEGTLDDSLTTFKSKFNPNVLELVGEYDLFLNKPMYDAFEWALKVYKKGRTALRNRKK